MAMSSISDLLYDVFNSADLDKLSGEAGGGYTSGCMDDIMELAESSTLSELMDSPIFSDASLFSLENLFSHSKLPFLEQPDSHLAAKQEVVAGDGNSTVEDGSDAKKARRTLWTTPEVEAVLINERSIQGVAAPQSKKTKRNEKEEVKDNRMTHITVERNRRKQMNDNLAILRSLMPTSYVQRGDQASIVGGVVDFVKELQQLLQSLEGQKQRKAYVESLSPRVTTSSTRPSVLARTSTTTTTTTNSAIQIQTTTSSTSPRSSQQSIGFCPQVQRNVHQLESDGDSYNGFNHELGATSKSAVAQVEVKISGSNVHLNTVSQRAPGQLLSIISTLETLSLQILHLNITTLDSGTTILYNFTLKIGIDCKLCVDELAEAVQVILREAHAMKGRRCRPA